MHPISHYLFVFVFPVILAMDHQAPYTDLKPGSSLKTGLGLIKRVLVECEKDKDLGRCLKVQALKITNRAIKSPSLEIIDGITLQQPPQHPNRTGRLQHVLDLDSNRIDDSRGVDHALIDAIGRFVSSRVVSVNLPRLAALVGLNQNFSLVSHSPDEDADDESSDLTEEARGRKRRRWQGPFMALLAVKSTFMAMAYKSIAAMAGAALIIGKMALVLTAVLGLKKLLHSGGGHGKSSKTTFEIVKHPVHSHSYTNSVDDGSEVGVDGDYHRSLDEIDKFVIDRIYKTELYH